MRRKVFTKFFIICFLGLLLTSCKSKKMALDSYNNEDMEIPNKFNSFLAINYKLDKNGIQDTFNVIIDQYLAGDLEIDDYGLDIKIKKEQDAKLEFEGRKVLVNLPVQIGLEKATIFNTIKANGALDLTFISDLEIDSSWNLSTKSSLADYRWITKPKLQMGLLSLPIENLANSIIEKSKDQLSQNIDLAIKEQFGLRERMLEMISYVEEPYLMDTLYEAWMLLSPDSILIAEVQNRAEWTVGKLGVFAGTQMSSSKPERIAGLTLPQFTWENNFDELSTINIQTEFEKPYIEGILQKNFVGKTFSSDGKNITIHDLKLFGIKDDIAVQVETSGSFTGTLVLKGKPKYDNSKKEVFVEDLDISVNTGNFLHKAGAWLFKSKIKNSLREMTRFSISENIDLAQEKLDAYIETVNHEGTAEFDIEIIDSDINHLIIKGDKIYAGLSVKLRIDAIIYDLISFQQLGTLPKFKG